MNPLPPTLNVGCGMVRIPDSIGVDFDPETRADVIHDLDHLPWPFPDRAFQRIVCSHVLEHLRDPRRCLLELHRVAQSGATIEIATPHYSSPESWGDITHYMHFSLKTFEPFYQEGNRKKRFELVSIQLLFGRGLPSLLGRCIAACFGLSFYEKYFCFIFPARNMKFVLRCL
jgi:SAM-dependent methyltransferase